CRRDRVVRLVTLLSYIMNRVDIAPGFTSGIGRGFDAIQVDAIAPEIYPTEQSNDTNIVTGTQVAQCGEQSQALFGIHCTVVKIESEVSDPILDFGFDVLLYIGIDGFQVEKFFRVVKLLGDNL